MNTAFISTISGIVALLAFIPYTQGILKKTVVPERTTWFLLSVNSIILYISYIATGNTDATSIAIALAIGQTIIFFLSIPYGAGGIENKFDLVCIAAAALIFIIWYFIKNPTISILLGISIDAIALLPTIKKILTDPQDGESASSWFLSLTGSTLTLLTIQKWSFDNSAYPIYLTFGNLVILLSIIWIRNINKKLHQ